MARTEVEAETFARLFLLAQHLGRGADAALERFGITGRQWLLLAVLVRAFPEQAPTLTQAATVYGSSRQNVKQIALQLADRGFVTLEPDPDDARATRLRLTDRVRLLDEPDALAVQRDFLRQTFAALSDAELARLHRLAARLVDARPGHPGAPKEPS